MCFQVAGVAVRQVQYAHTSLSLLSPTSSSSTPLLSRGIETHFNHLDPRSSFLHDPELLIIGESRNLVALVKGQLCFLAQLRLLNNGQLWLLGGSHEHCSCAGHQGLVLPVAPQPSSDAAKQQGAHSEEEAGVRERRWEVPG